MNTRTTVRNDGVLTQVRATFLIRSVTVQNQTGIECVLIDETGTQFRIRPRSNATYIVHAAYTVAAQMSGTVLDGECTLICSDQVATEQTGNGSSLGSSTPNIEDRIVRTIALNLPFVDTVAGSPDIYKGIIVSKTPHNGWLFRHMKLSVMLTQKVPTSEFGNCDYSYTMRAINGVLSGPTHAEYGVEGEHFSSDFCLAGDIRSYELRDFWVLQPGEWTQALTLYAVFGATVLGTYFPTVRIFGSLVLVEYT